ncbi:MAG: glutamine--fructose-6-phosphate transaminase (isomerizing) [Syntrophobacteraceae bacterium]|nr:glutamine--fructose-6-phosphate transaminase (isomerizing) [Desulfobacteraceae bacterium]
MCGIVGFVGNTDGREVLIEGLKRLEYRGYDSAGIAMIDPGRKLRMVRCRGKINALESRVREQPISGNVGIAHTRWATHGKPCEENAHPHLAGPFAVVHNGIIENYVVLKEELLKDGFTFSSETDTEVIVKLLEREWRRGTGYHEAVKCTIRRLKGSFAVVFLNEEEPGELVAAKRESPLIMGLGDDACYLASDVPAILPYTRKVIYFHDDDLVFISSSGYRIESLKDESVQEREPQWIDWNPVMAEKAGYKHFMLKEIHEQERAIIDTFRSVVDLNSNEIRFPELNLDADALRGVQRVMLIACGTSYHAGLVGKYMIESLCRVPVEVDLASEFRSRDPVLNGGTLMIVISQSGETADTRVALKEAMELGAQCRAIVNVVGSSIARMAQGVIYTHAGPEIGVASTKAFTTQVAALYLLALYWGSTTGRISREDTARMIQDLVELPGKIREFLNGASETIQSWARRYYHAKDFLYLGRGNLYPIALEGALKLKEISYIHAEGYAAGEMKHGPIALIDEYMPVVVLLKHGSLYEKMLSNIQEVRARDGQVLAFVEGEPDESVGPPEVQCIVPRTSDWLAPILYVVPLQLFAYHVAVLRGTDVDQPRNLAKSVTVE